MFVRIIVPLLCIYYKFSLYVQCVEQCTIVGLLVHIVIFFPTVLYHLLEFLMWRKREIAYDKILLFECKIKKISSFWRSSFISDVVMTYKVGFKMT